MSVGVETLFILGGLVWRELYSQQVELLREAEEIGAGAVQRVQRDIVKSRNVLRDLGISVDGESIDEGRS